MNYKYLMYKYLKYKNQFKNKRNFMNKKTKNS